MYTTIREPVYSYLVNFEYMNKNGEWKESHTISVPPVEDSHDLLMKVMNYSEDTFGTRSVIIRDVIYIQELKTKGGQNE